MRIALVGYGRMGRAVEEVAAAREHAVVARIGRPELEGGPPAIAGALADAEVAIDFSTGALVPVIAGACADAGVSLVTGTTGLPSDALDALARAADSGIGVVHGPNFSIGVQLFFRVARSAAHLFDAVGGYDTHIHEAHHRHKLDHPSGTARRLADLLVDALAEKRRWEAGPPEARAAHDVLYVTSTRAGEIPGTHTLGFEGAHDRIELVHEARGREGFAAGAVRAAEWVRTRRGVFTFEEVVDELLAGTGQDARGIDDGRSG